jgi:hypothetical protein
MKIKIKIDRKKALLEGHEDFGEKIIEIDVNKLTKPQGKILLDAFYSNENGYDISSYPYESVGSKNPTIKDVQFILNSAIQKKEKEEQEKLKKLEEEIQLVIKNPEIVLTYTSDLIEFLHEGIKEKVSYMRYYFKTWFNSKVQNDPRIKRLLPEINKQRRQKTRESLREAINTEIIKIENKQKIKEEEDRKDKEKHDWILKHGSERLKKGLQAGYHIQTLYIQEKVEYELGKDYYFDSKQILKWEDRNNPTEKALDLEKELKKKGYKAEIAWVTKKFEYENDEHYEAIHILFEDRYDVFRKL